MKNLYLAFLSILLLFANECFAQESRLEKLLGKGFRSIPAVDRGYHDLCEDCKLKFTQRRIVDTSGIIYNNNYILFRNYFTDSVIVGKSFAYFHELPVSNAEFQEFQNWVRDSMARERIYEALELEEALEYISLEIDKSKIMLDEHRDVKAQYRELGNLNWNKKISYSDPNIIPNVADLYLPQPERFYRKREFDSRKLVFKHCETLSSGTQLRNQTALITYPESWALGTNNRFGETVCLGQCYEQQFPNSPILTYSSSQARAFCQWKEKQLQRELDKLHLDYVVSVNLPLSTELTSEETSLFTIPSRDYTDNWKITVSEYQEFMNAVRDSLVLELLYQGIEDDSRALKLLSYDEYYFYENDLEMVEFDPSRRARNHDEFSFQSMSKVHKKFSHEIDSLRRIIDKTELVFRYYIQDPTNKAIIGKTTYDTRWERNSEIFEIDAFGEPIGRDLNLGWYNNLQHQTDALAHQNLARFIHRIDINIRPSIDIEQQNPEARMKEISYEQALAFYHWKYPIWKAKPDDDWQNFVFPTKEQFEAIQRGESIIIPEHLIEYPVPLFHYVVQFIEKK